MQFLFLHLFLDWLDWTVLWSISGVLNCYENQSYLFKCRPIYLTLSRNIGFLPLDTTFVGFICQFMSIGIMIVTKLVLISNLLIYAPYTYPLGMVMEFFLILPFAFFFKSMFYFQGPLLTCGITIPHEANMPCLRVR